MSVINSGSGSGTISANSAEGGGNTSPPLEKANIS